MALLLRRLDALLHEVVGQFLTYFEADFSRVALQDQKPFRNLLEVDLRSLDSEVFRQPDGLAATVLENFDGSHPWSIPCDMTNCNGLHRVMRVDVERGNPSALSRPCDGELRHEGRLAGAALALRDRNHQPRHSIALADVDGQGHPFGRLTRNETPTPPTIPVAGLVPATHV